jgi:hypothetical protein
VCCRYSDIWSVWFSETVIIAVLKSVARKRLLKTEKTSYVLQLVIFGECGSLRLLELLVVAIRKWSIDPVSNPKPRRETL